MSLRNSVHINLTNSGLSEKKNSLNRSMCLSEKPMYSRGKEIKEISNN